MINLQESIALTKLFFESEQEILNGAEAVDADVVFANLEKKHFE